jgi:heat shock 70kDa protein 1/2/6/8
VRLFHIRPVFAVCLIGCNSYEGERTQCRDNRLLGEFELTGIPPMPRGQAELVTTFEVDANGLLKVSAQDRASGRKASISMFYAPHRASAHSLSAGITNSVGRLSSAEIDQMIKDAEQFKQADKDFSARHEAKSDLEAYVHQVEATITSPEISMKLKRGAKGQVEAELARALEKLEIEDSTSDELRKAQLGIKRALQKATAGIR